MSADKNKSQARLVEDLRDEFKKIAKLDIVLAMSTQAQCDMIQEGDFAAALKLTATIEQRLELLTMAASLPKTLKR